MNTTPELVVMLTHHDRTIASAGKFFQEAKNSKAMFWGMKEEGIPLEEMKQIYREMKSCGKTTFLEVVAYTEQECLSGARIAVECGCDYLMGTMYFDSIQKLCDDAQIKYMPFVGRITGRPSILEGTLKEMVAEAKSYLEKGAFGIDLLGYRYTGDAASLNCKFVEQVNCPVCLAGSINSNERLDEVKQAAPWAFTIGGAFWEEKFGNNLAKQIDYVCDYMEV